MTQEQTNKIKIGEKVMVFYEGGNPRYTGTCIGFSKRGILIEQDGFLAGKRLEVINNVEKLETKN